MQERKFVIKNEMTIKNYYFYTLKVSPTVEQFSGFSGGWGFFFHLLEMFKIKL